MPAMVHDLAATRDAGRPFTLVPFRGLRFDPDTVGDLSTVISPPYDVLDADTVRHPRECQPAQHRAADPVTTLRAPLPGRSGPAQKWRDKSYLRADEEPTLYLYEYSPSRSPSVVSSAWSGCAPRRSG